MSDTKEQILMTALRLFARDGYEAVSVSMIAGELGMTKGALYKHYKNKRDIFERIVERMFALDSERAQEYDMPEGTIQETPEAYGAAKLNNIKEFTIAQYSFWTADEFAASFRKMLVLEQYRDAEMNELYQNCVVSGPVQYMEDMFREMMTNGILKAGDPGQLALEFFAPLYLLINMSDGVKNNVDAVKLLEEHIEHFIAHYAN